ncbi:MAG TPA: hypothetical protein VJY62_16715 [Bacteroidia bacterium]|nr:hypothetical protein [Bacteroidia bacterium]
MKKINTLAELKAEKIYLRQKQFQLEAEIKNNFNSLKESFAPLQLVTDGASKMLVNRNHGLVNDTVGILVDFVLKNILLRKSGFILRLILPFIARNTANNLLMDNKKKILGWIGELILKTRRKNKDEIYDKATADIDDY